MTPREILAISPVIPVVAIDDAAKAVALAEALVEGGIRIIEVTLRTPAALDAIEAIAKAVPKMVLGAGTVINAEQFDAVESRGVEFVISPGFTPTLLHHASHKKIPLIPGVANASAIMMGLEYGLDTFKLFPANIVGGVGALKAFAGPFGNVAFCPTGGINLQNMAEYLAQPNVLCVGGSWIATPQLIGSGDFDTIRNNAAEALKAL